MEVIFISVITLNLYVQIVFNKILFLDGDLIAVIEIMVFMNVDLNMDVFRDFFAVFRV